MIIASKKSIKGSIASKKSLKGSITTKEKISGFVNVGILEPILQEKTIMSSTSTQTITPDADYDGLSKVTVKAIPTVAQATPSITVDSTGLITASATQSEGYVTAGTKTAIQQLTKQLGKTVTPGTSDVVAVESGKYTTGTVYVKGDSNLTASNIKSGINIFGVTGSYVDSTPIEISTDAGMEAVLISNNVGKVYKFTGVSDTYTNGDLYVVEVG